MPTRICSVTAQREFEEETGVKPSGPFIPLKPIKQKGGKIVHAWAFEGDCDPKAIKSNTFTMEWPPHSGRQQEFPEIDRAEFFDLAHGEEEDQGGAGRVAGRTCRTVAAWESAIYDSRDHAIVRRG
jgi:predicted NUDIX family NTP pyrophosphohydrolase